ncbi:MAG: DUF3822 family protein [Bacteroidales bacterium]|nr:DUF3822 family protein [Bacteroidales bacterium]
MKKYITSGTFTLIPHEIYTRERGIEALEGQFALQGEHVFNEYGYKDAVVAFALGKDIAGEDVYPFIVRLLEEAEGLEAFNKVVFHYSGAGNVAHIIICTGEELKLANSFKADSFESALYFLFLSIQQLHMNPRQCTVRVCSGINEEQEATIAKFFNGVEKNNLDNLIQ